MWKVAQVRLRAAVPVATLLAGCGAPSPDVCDEARDRIGVNVCLTEIRDEADWEEVSVGWSDASDVLRLAPFLVPARKDARLPTLFADGDGFLLHLCLLSQGFHDDFPGLTAESYPELVLPPDERELFAGSVHAYVNADLEPDGFGFSVETNLDPAGQLSEEQVRAVHRALQARFAPGPLSYRPLNQVQRDAAASWSDPGFQIREATGPVATYRPYTTGVTFGRVRIFDGAGLEAALEAGAVGWQDLVVVDTVPTTLDAVVAGIITGEPQDVLSHLNVLSNRRGTPNLFVAGAAELLADHADRLVRLEVSTSHYSVAPAELGEAEAHWLAHRPRAELGGPPDLAFTDMVDLGDVPVATPEERGLAVRRFGGKATHLATVSPLLAASQRVTGFAVPVGLGDAFFRENGWTVELADGPMSLSYRDTLALWLEDETFRTDPAVRRTRLTDLTDHMRDVAVVDPQVVERLRQQIVDTFGAEDVMVRLRSSSNAEDGVVFNGAGLYDSTRACAADGDPAATASACDPNKLPRDLAEGLRRVWASLWSPRAFEEREYFQLDQLQVQMGVLVSERFEGELANGVAVTGNPVDPDDPRFIVNAQLGETSVVTPPPGVVGEVDALTVSDNGFVAVERLQTSSLVPDGGFVLSNDQLSELGLVLAALRESYPVDGASEATRPVFLELELKIDVDGVLRIKQARPFQTGGDDPLATCQVQDPGDDP